MVRAARILGRNHLRRDDDQRASTTGALDFYLHGSATLRRDNSSVLRLFNRPRPTERSSVTILRASFTDTCANDFLRPVRRNFLLVHLPRNVLSVHRGRTGTRRTRPDFRLAERDRWRVLRQSSYRDRTRWAYTPRVVEKYTGTPNCGDFWSI